MVILKSTTKRKTIKKSVKVKVNFEIDIPLENFKYYDDESFPHGEEIEPANAIEAATALELFAEKSDNALEYFLYEGDWGTINTDKWEIEILD